MSKSVPPEAASPEQDNPLFAQRVIKFLAYPFSLAAGLLVTHTSVRDSAYQKAKKRGGFCDIEETFGNEHSHDLALRLNERISKEEFLERSISNKVRHSHAVQEQMEKLGIAGFTSKWNYINRGNKQKAIIEGLTVGGIAIGAILTIANSKSLTQLFSKDCTNNEQER